MRGIWRREFVCKMIAQLPRSPENYNFATSNCIPSETDETKINKYRLDHRKTANKNSEKHFLQWSSASNFFERSIVFYTLYRILQNSNITKIIS